MLPKIGFIIDVFAQPFMVMRRDAPVLADDGHAYDSPSTAIIFSGAIYPQKGDLEVQLPEGNHDRASLWVFTKTLLRSAEDPALHDADLVKYLGRLYRVDRCEAWEQGGFWRSVATKLPQDSTYASVYFGPALDAASSAQLKTLGLLWLAANDALVYVNVTGANKAYFAAPAAFGTLTVEGATGTVTQQTIDSVLYNVWTSTDAGIGPITLRAF